MTRQVTTGESDTFFCKIKNVQVAEGIDVDDWGVNLTDFNPVIYSGNYHSLGRYPGTIGEFYHSVQYGCARQLVNITM